MKYIKKTRKIIPPTPGGVCNLSSVVGQVIRIAKTVRKTSDPATIRDVLVDALIGTLHQLQQLRKKAPSDLEKGKGGATKESCSRTIAYVAQVLNAVLDSKVRIDEILKRIEELEKQVEENER